MNKRQKLGLIIFAGIVLFGIGAYVFLTPILEERKAAQPPKLPREVTPVGPTQPATSGEVPKPSVPVAASTLTMPASDTAKLRALENRSRIVVARVGSGVSSDGFLGYADVEEFFTAHGLAALRIERAVLQKQHPPTAPLYGLSTSAVSSNISGNDGDAALVATVDAIQRIDSGDPSKSSLTSGKRVTLTFVKQSDRTYLIDRMQWGDISL
ncbi:MAG: hypothetical protein AAB879_01025 [Patescibacteria group bacterium]